MMTDGQKATATLNYLEGLDSKTVINILHPALDDYQLAMIYDRLVDDGVMEGNDENDDLGGDLPPAITYVREQLGESRLAVIRAQVNICYEQRRPIETDYDDEVIDLLEEYGEENDLSEEWWSESIELEDIIARL